MAHIKKRLGNGQVIVAWRDQGGTSRSVSTTLRSASAIIALDAAGGEVGTPGSAPLDAVLHALIDERRGIRDVTRSNYRKFLTNALEGTELGASDVWAINTALVERWVDEQVRQRRNPNAVLHFLRVLLGYPVSAGLISAPPVDVRLIPLPGKKAANRSDSLEPLTAAEVWMLLDQLRSDTRPFVHMLVDGVDMRCAAGTDCAEIDAAINTGLLTTARRLAPTTDSTLEDHPLGPQTWALGALTIEALTELRGSRLSAGTWTAGRLAFPGRNGVSPMAVNGIAYRVRTAGRRAADAARGRGDEAAAFRLGRVDAAALRATAAVLAHQGGASVYDIARQLGRSVSRVRAAYGLWIEPRSAA